jgi:putative CocE/NonD family hydrolase
MAHRPNYLDAAHKTLSTRKSGKKTEVSYGAEPDADITSAAFSTKPFEQDTEITGPMKLKLWISSSVDDADLFAIVHHIDADGKEILYMGQMGVEIAAAYGWLRISHRKLDPKQSTSYRPWHTHDELQLVKPGEVVPVEIEIWPASVVVKKGHCLVLEVASKDDPRIFPFTHTDAKDRIQSGTNTIHTGGNHDAYLLLPVIPTRGGKRET